MHRRSLVDQSFASNLSCSLGSGSGQKLSGRHVQELRPAVPSDKWSGWPPVHSRKEEPPEFFPLPERNSLVRDPGEPDRGLPFGGPGLDCCNSRTAHQRRNERGS